MSEDMKTKMEAMDAEMKESAKEGAKNFLDDAQRVKDGAEAAGAARAEEKAAKKAEKKEKIDATLAELKASFEAGADKSAADGATLMDSLKGIMEDAGIEVKENEKVKSAFAALRKSFEEGIEEFKSDFNFTKDVVDDLTDEKKQEKAEKKAKRSAEFDKAIKDFKDLIDE